MTLSSETQAAPTTASPSATQHLQAATVLSRQGTQGWFGVSKQTGITRGTHTITPLLEWCGGCYPLPREGSVNCAMLIKAAYSVQR